MATKNNKYANRPSYFEVAEHFQDDVQNYGFDYHGKLFERSISKIYFDDPRKTGILQSFDDLLSYVIDSIKYIKKFRNYAINKNHIKMR
ncbi:MAG: hypothetical protein WC979_01570 [Candidatus Pacearchaeota archaeon]|jgi:hypothetical protein|nr:hypothetical protein [Clostridia bacterium]